MLARTYIHVCFVFIAAAAYRNGLRASGSLSNMGGGGGGAAGGTELEARLREWCHALASPDAELAPVGFLGLICTGKQLPYAIGGVRVRVLTHEGAARQQPGALKYSTHIRPVEEKMCQLLINAAPDTKAAAGTGLCMHVLFPSYSLFSFMHLPCAVSTLMNAASGAHAVLEPDGSALREFYTTLNLTQSPSHEQLFNVYSFALLRAWIEALYVPRVCTRTQPPADAPPQPLE